MIDKELLMNRARIAAKNAYCPHSNFHVGAAVLTNSGLVFTGCNIENDSYGLTICAERVAIFKCISEIDHTDKIIRIAVTCSDSGPHDPFRYKTPCGSCRQVMRQFLDDDAHIDVDGVKTFSMQELLPLGFTLTMRS